VAPTAKNVNRPADIQEVPADGENITYSNNLENVNNGWFLNTSMLNGWKGSMWAWAPYFKFKLLGPLMWVPLFEFKCRACMNSTNVSKIFEFKMWGLHDMGDGLKANVHA
jgi:hypothetical protein